MERVINKAWGYEKIIEQTDTHVVKHLFVKARHRLSKQYHMKKVETMFLVSGKARLLREDRTYEMKLLTPYMIVPQTVHRLIAMDEDALIVEISSIELDDVERLEDDYGRI